MASVTAQLAEYIAARRYDALTAAEVTVAKQCLMDYLGVAMAGRNQPLVTIIRKQLLSEGGHPQASLVGIDRRMTASQASLINGAAAHAHDYDDVHTAMSGHPTVPVAPAVMALAERERKTGRELIQAFVAGLETECLLGRYLGGSHYARGFHATATLGTFGAAAACANLLGLDAGSIRHVLGIAATQAAGLKSMFGTMCKPLHAGKAAASGLLAAELGAAGFDSNPEALETEQGFALTHSDAPSPEAFEAALTAGNMVPATLFKYHAACYMTHSAMEAVRNLKETHGIRPEDVEAVAIHVDRGHFSVCNIQAPQSGLEAKFSLRFTTAMILHGVDTANVDGYTDALVNEPALVATRDKIRVLAHETPDRETLVTIRMNDGEVWETRWNVAVPESDLEMQWRKLRAKFGALAVPAVGEQNASRLVDKVASLEGANALGGLFNCIRGAHYEPLIR